MSALPVTEREGCQRGKNGIGPRMKYGHTNHIRKNRFTNGGSSVTCHLLLSICTCPLCQQFVSPFVLQLLSLHFCLSVCNFTTRVFCHLPTLLYGIQSMLWIVSNVNQVE